MAKTYKFEVCTNRANAGFMMPIGWAVISVRFGYFNYCGNHEVPATEGQSPIRQQSEFLTCDTAEVAIRDSADGGFVVAANFLEDSPEKWGDSLDCCDSVIGYCTPEEVAKIIANLQASPEDDPRRYLR